MNDGYQPSNEFPLPSGAQADVTANCEFAMGCGVVQFW
jgi:hypothetical protein